MQMSYWRFAAMIATSTVVMFGLMYLNTYALDHVAWSQTRAWMALLMGATMAIVMLAFMLGMYDKKRVNIAIFAGSAALFALCLWLVRSQTTVDDVDYMRAMVPHHSIAILTSSRARIDDPRVRKLADEIIAAQRREIAEMKYLVAQLDSGAGGAAKPSTEPEGAPQLMPARQAIASAEIARIDLAELDDAEIERVLGRVPYCGFAYSRAAGPVVAMAASAGAAGPTNGVVKIHGRLVELTATTGEPPRGSTTLVDDGIEVVVEPRGDSAATVDGAVARLRIEGGPSVGYAGFHRCAAPAAGGSATR